METKFIAAQARSTGLIGPWLALGVRGNILHHSVNETYTAAVFEMTRMRQEYPEDYTQVSPPRCHRPASAKWAFRAVVVEELLATLFLLAEVIALLMAMTGTRTVDEDGQSP